MCHRHSRTHRSAFTLVEMLVVIAIIAVLVSLLLAAVMPIMLRGQELRCFNEIKQLDNAIVAWQQTFKVSFPPPSRLFLSNNYADYGQTPLGQLSLQYLSTIWPRLNWSSGIDWSGGLGMPNGGVVLEGDQCLVFFLGGIPAVDSNGNLGVTGFSTNPQNPTQLGGNRLPPLFEFAAGRLFWRIPQNPFPSYQDTWQNMNPATKSPVPYWYFSSGKRRNGYGDFFISPLPASSLVPNGPYYGSFLNGQPQYANPNTWQIISAGRNGVFGPGGQYNPSTGVPPPGDDDQCNFSDRPLGVPQGS
jgi:prepilin-type N-terminal cleavage/methylation domain-containing protein